MYVKVKFSFHTTNTYMYELCIAKAIGISFSNFYANGYDDPKDNSEVCK